MFKTIKKIATHITCVQKALLCVVDELRNRSFVHDQSKFNENELKGYLRFEQMPEGLKYGSEEYKAAMAEVMKDNNCFELHSAENDHHPEYWDAPDCNLHIELMGLFPLIEMTCDWAGAHLAYGNKSDWQESIEFNIGKYQFTDCQKYVIRQTADFLEDKISELQKQKEKNND